MPVSSKRPCSYPGCPRLTRSGKCERHRNTDDRPSASARGYTHQWTKVRNNYARNHPVCEIRELCNGDPVEEVDHIEPVDEGGEWFDEENLQSACKPCHGWKTKNIDHPTSTADQ